MWDGSSPYYFDEAAAQSAVDFFPRNLVLTKGEWLGRPFILEPWQANDIVRPLFGWKRISDGTRRYRRCFVWVPRKNGKSELAAGIAILLLVADGEPAGEVYSIATKRDQARVVFNMASTMVTMSQTLADVVLPFKDALYCSALGSSFKPLSGMPKGSHGLSMSGLIGDEVHEWQSDRLYTFVHQSIGARRQPLEFLISSAGEVGGVGEEFFRQSQAILSGDVDDPETLVVIYGADEERDRVDPNYWKSEEARRAANPNYGLSVKADYLETECKRAQERPRLENDYKRYHLGLWVEQTTRWIPMDAWGQCGQLPELREELRLAAHEDRPIVDDVARRMIPVHKNGRWKSIREKMRGRRCFAGIDLSSTTDLTTCVLVFPPEKNDDLWTVAPRFYVPEVGLKQRARIDKVPYEAWRASGALVATPGNAVDYAYLKRDLFADAEIYDIQAVAIDRWNATQISIEISDEGLEVIMFGQGFASMSAPAKYLETLIIERRLDHGGHPVLTWNARNVAVETDPAENIKPSKAKSRERIDGIVGLIEGIGATLAAPKGADVSDFIANPVMA